MAAKTYSAGVKSPQHVLAAGLRHPACLKITPQAGVDREEIAAAVVTLGDAKQVRFND